MAVMLEKNPSLDVNAIVAEVVRRLKPHLQTAVAPQPAKTETKTFQPGPKPFVPPATGSDGVFATVDGAVQAAAAAQKQLAVLDLDKREEICAAVRRVCTERAEELGRMEYEESRIGRPDHKVEKLKLVARVPGVEVLKTATRIDQDGMHLIAAAPFGVIGMVTPATHSVPTMAGNAINVIAAGNTAVFSPHPAASRCLRYALQLFNREIRKKTGLSNLLTVMEKPTIETANQLFNHPLVALICVTGGPAVVKAAMKSGKRVIAAGPGNPPAVVDESADLDKAARDIMSGAAFDNNLLCIGEKEIFVVASVADAFMASLEKAGAVRLGTEQIERLTKAAFAFSGEGGASGHAHVKREFVGQGTDILAAAAGARLARKTDLLFGETVEDHPFVQEEQMMPFLPVVRVPDAAAAIDAAAKAEHGYRHTAVIHSNNTATVMAMAQRLNTTIFVQNAPCTAALGLGGPGYLSYSIATPTGEGVTTPLTFTRQRQMVMGGKFKFA